MDEKQGALTEEQKRLAEENVGLVGYAVGRFLQKTAVAMEWDKLLSIGYVALCEAARRYQPERGKFSNFACLVIENKILREMKFRSRKKRRPKGLVSYQEQLAEDLTIEQTLADQSQDVERDAMLHQFMEGLSGRERILIRMVADGYRQRDVGERLHMTHGNVGRIVRQIQRKWAMEEGNAP